MNIPKELKYAPSHEWLKIDGEIAVVGISDFAQSELGDIVFVNLPEVGSAVVIDDAIADIESVKAVSDIYSPVSGTILEINEELIDSPEKINEDSYSAWLFKVEKVSETKDMLSAEEYEKTAKEGV